MKNKIDLRRVSHSMENPGLVEEKSFPHIPNISLITSQCIGIVRIT